MKNTTLTALALLVAPWLVLLSSPARGAVAEVVDNAGFFSADAVRQANPKLADVDAQYHKQMRVETYAEIPAELRGSYSDANKRQFFQRWTVRRAEEAKVTGVMVLICRDPSSIQVEVGKSTAASGAFTQADRTRIVGALGEAFRAKNYDEGLVRAADIFSSAISSRANSPGQPAGASSSSPSSSSPNAEAPPAASSTPPAASSTPRPYQFPSPSSAPPTMGRPRASFGWIFILLLIIGFFIVLRIIRGLFGGGGRGNYPSNYGPGYGSNYPPNYGPGYGSGGGGFGRGFGGGILGGLLGSWVGNQMYRREDSSNSSSSSSSYPPPSSGGGGGFNEPPPSDFSSGSSGDASSGGTDFGGSSSSSSSGGDFSGGSSGDANSGGTDF